MTVATSNTNLVLRKRFGAFLRGKREEVGLTQMEIASLVNYGWIAMVSQIERGVSALPAHDLSLWAQALRMDAATLANMWVYYIEPDVYAALYGKDPYAIEQLPRSAKTIKAAPGRAPLRSVKQA